MKNIFGKQEELELFSKGGELVYEFNNSDGVWYEITYDERGNQLTYKNSNGYWAERTYDENGNQLTFKNSKGVWSEITYDENGNELTYKNSEGFWHKSTYDENGNELSFKNSDGGWYEQTFDENGNKLSYKNSEGYWSERTYDKNGNELTYKDSKGVLRGFDIPEYTMKNLVKQTVYLPVNGDYITAVCTFENDWVHQETVQSSEGYFFTPEQLNEYTANVIKQALKTASHNNATH